MKKLIWAFVITSVAVFFSEHVSAASVKKIYWADAGTYKIQRANPDGTDIEDIVTTDLQEPRDITIDPVADKIYWTDIGSGKIQRANLDGSNIEDLVTGLNDSRSIGIALNVPNGKMYWTIAETGKIQRANLDGSNIEDLITGLHYPYGIVLDILNGKMYWSHDYRIWRANLDGTNIEDLIALGMDCPISIALDIDNNKMYFPMYNGVSRADLDGSNFELVVSADVWFLALDVPDGKIYWTDVHNHKIQQANMDGSNIEDLITGLTEPAGIVIAENIEVDDLWITPIDGFTSQGREAGPFSPVTKSYTLKNIGPNNIDWTASVTQPWLDISLTSGTLEPNDVNSVQITINANANGMASGAYYDTLTITNLTSGENNIRSVELLIHAPYTDTIYVDANAVGINDGSSWADAYNFLADALATANSEPNITRIHVAQGIYTPDTSSAQPDGSGDRFASFALINGVAVYGGFPTGGSDMQSRNPNLYETILLGDLLANDAPDLEPHELSTHASRLDNSYHVFCHIQALNLNSSAVLDGFTITSGNARGDSESLRSGAGMYNNHCSPTVTDCTFSKNSAKYYGGGMYNGNQSDLNVANCIFSSNFSEFSGGAIYNNESDPSITNCTFSKNSADYGSGMFNNNSNPNITRCFFNDNLAYGVGGGMRNSFSNPNIIDCTFSNNSADIGGGIDNELSDSNITNCTFSKNSAEYAGGMYNYCSNLNITNCSFSGNSAERVGGAMHNDGTFGEGCSPIITNCTFSNNSSEYGGGLYNYGLLGPCNPFLNNCILWGNTASIDGDQIYDYDAITTVNYSNIQGYHLSIDPCFVDPCNGDFHLMSQAGRWNPGTESWIQDDVTSPCIDAGDPDGSIGYELFPNGARINMGAYGGTVQASKSYFGQPVCEKNIPGDINGDCIINFVDLAIMTRNWLKDSTE